MQSLYPESLFPEITPPINPLCAPIASTEASKAGRIYESLVVDAIRGCGEVYDTSQRARTIELPRFPNQLEPNTTIADGWMPRLRLFVEVKGGGDAIGSAYKKWWHNLDLIDTGTFRNARWNPEHPQQCGYLFVLVGEGATRSEYYEPFYHAWQRHAHLYSQNYHYAWLVKAEQINRQLFESIGKVMLEG